MMASGNPSCFSPKEAATLPRTDDLAVKGEVNEKPNNYEQRVNQEHLAAATARERRKLGRK